MIDDLWSMEDTLDRMTKPPNHTKYVKEAYGQVFIKCIVFVSNMYCLFNERTDNSQVQ
jgi:hypothetical protein